jgi:hypothetical protein
MLSKPKCRNENWAETHIPFAFIFFKSEKEYENFENKYEDGDRYGH